MISSMRCHATVNKSSHDEKYTCICYKFVSYMNANVTPFSQFFTSNAKVIMLTQLKTAM